MSLTEQSRRDDIESLGNSLLYLLHGSLPWQGIYAADHESKMRRIGEMKEGQALRDLLQESPPAFTVLFDHARSIAFEDKPDYNLLISAFEDTMKTNGWKLDGKFDWMVKGPDASGTLIPGEYKFDLERAHPLYANGWKWI